MVSVTDPYCRVLDFLDRRITTIIIIIIIIRETTFYRD
jgi:hypothetical protein